MKQLKYKRWVVIIVVIACLIFPLYVSAQKKKVSCVGNSITYGYGLSNVSTQSYPAQMQALLGSNSWSVGNFGVSARTMLKKGDMPYWSEQSFTNSKTFLPDFVMIELGTNDAKSWNWNNRGHEFVSNYKEMIQIFKNLSSKPEVWIGLVPPGNNVSWNILGAVLKDSVNKRIKQVALESGVGLIDIFDAFGGNTANWFNLTNFQSDGIHPTATGAAIIAQKVKEMILMPKPDIVYADKKIIAPDAVDYQWYIDNVAVTSANGGKQKEMNVTKSGTYKVSIRLNSNNETRIISNELIVNILSGINSKSADIGLKVYPNPAIDVMNILTENQYTNDSYSISDLSGKTVLSGRIMNGSDKINISNLSTGIYTLAYDNKCTRLFKK